MKVFIFESIEQVSGNYHCNGGLVVIAKDKEHVKEVIKTDDDVEISEDEWLNVEVYELKNTTRPTFWVMPDAGCC